MASGLLPEDCPCDCQLVIPEPVNRICPYLATQEHPTSKCICRGAGHIESLLSFRKSTSLDSIKFIQKLGIQEEM